MYILDALNGFVKQKTDFPYVCLVMDDASTDGEQQVIKDFLNHECAMDDAKFYEIEEANIVIVPHKTNRNCTMAVYFLKFNLYGSDKKTALLAPWREHCKYEAFCEGDDYWIDYGKLQMQVSFLNKHYDVGLCYTDFLLLNGTDNAPSSPVFANNLMHRSQNFSDHLKTGGFIAPLSWVYRLSVFNNLDILKKVSDGTFAMALSFYLYSTVAYLDYPTSVYRAHDGSASRPLSDEGSFYYRHGVFKTKQYYAKCSEDKSLLKWVSVDGYSSLINLAISCKQNSFVEEAIEYLSNCAWETAQYYADLEHIRSSFSYRIGYVIVWPFSKMKALFTRILHR